MTKFIAVVSGKGGVGKTTTALNLAQALTDLGRKTVILDANLVTPNIAIHLGIMNPECTINKFLRNEKSIKDITYMHECGVSFIPASPSYVEFQKTNVQQLTEIFEHLDETAEFVVIDAPSGLGYEVTQILKNSDEAIIVANPTLSSVMDALKTIHLARDHDNIVAGVVLNMTNRGRNELKQDEVQRILGQSIIANVKLDRKIRKSAYQQTPLVYKYPRSRSAKQYKQIAAYLSLQQQLP